MTRKGMAKWLGNADKEDLKDGTALLEITVNNTRGTVTTRYWVWSNGKQSRLMKQGGNDVYTVKDGRCTCKDAQKGNDCKHARAVPLAIAKLS